MSFVWKRAYAAAALDRLISRIDGSDAPAARIVVQLQDSRVLGA